VRRSLTILCCVLVPALLQADVDRTTYRGAKPGVEVTFPGEWTVAEQASFPGLLVSATDRRAGANGRMTLTVEQLKGDETVRGCAERNLTVLAALRFKTQPLGQHATGAILLQGTTPDGQTVVRQAYRRFDGDRSLVFVLTLSAPRAIMQRYVRAFDDTLRSITRLPDAQPPAAKPEDAEADVEAAPPSPGDAPPPASD
jgi:hypothetical protein